MNQVLENLCRGEQSSSFKPLASSPSNLLSMGRTEETVATTKRLTTTGSSQRVIVVVDEGVT